MVDDGAALLRTQLAAAFEELEAGATHPLEVAVLAGLLARVAPSDPMVAEGSIEIDPEALMSAARTAVDAVLEIDEADDPAESWDALSALDEVCAAATWLQSTELVSSAVDEAVGSLRAFPEPWRVHAATATELLVRQPPRVGDPAGRLWAAVEASRWHRDEVEHDAELPVVVRERLGLSVVVRLDSFRRQLRAATATRAAMAAAEGLPDASPWTTLAHGAGWELALTLGEGDEVVLLLAGDARATFERDGVAVESRATAEGFVCEARAGQWRVVVDGRPVSFEVAG